MTTIEITAEKIESRIPSGWALKAYKEIKAMSEETPCFTANIYVDGRKIGTASNHGHGGPNDYHFATPEDREMVERVGAEYDPSKYGGLDTLIDDMCQDLDLTKIAKSHARKGFPVTVLIQSHGKEYPYHPTMGEGTFKHYGRTEVIGLRTLDHLASELAVCKAETYRIISGEAS